MNWAVIMAGGYGERFWPMSRRSRPKQLLPIVGDKTMIQQTVERLRPLFGDARMVVVTNREQAAAVRKQLPRLKHVLAEPVGRNTAPCIGLAAAYISRLDPRAVMAVVPADSYIRDVKRYRSVVKESLALAGQDDVLVTIGIKPTSPHTGYGYVQTGKKISPRFWYARRFVEKPDLKTAKKFLASGDYRWNAGMFVWSLRAVRAAFQAHQPVMWSQIEKITNARALARIYPKLGKISVDYAIMEKAANVVVANGDFDWDDVGDWAAVERHYPRDENGNVARGNFLGADAAGCIVVGDDGHLVGAVGVRDLVVVHTRDATLVCHKSQAQKVRDLVKALAAKKPTQKFL